MSVQKTARKRTQVLTVSGFLAACAVGFAWLWTSAGGTIPVLAEPGDYRVSFVVDDVRNLREVSEVRIAGVEIGRVESQEEHDGDVLVTLSIDDSAAPLHDGVEARIGVKSLIGSSYVELQDGEGEELDSGYRLPEDQVAEAVDVDELFETLDPATQESLRGSLRSLARSTAGTGRQLDALAGGLGQVGGPGATVLDAVAAQGEDLTVMTVEARELLDALDAGQGDLVDLVADAQALTRVTAQKQAAVEATVRRLPGLVQSLSSGTLSLQQLSAPLAPVVADLRAAAPGLSSALVQLPQVTRDLDGLLPSLDRTLDRAPATLAEVPEFGAAVSDLVPDAQVMLRDLDPMLSYLAPYGHDLGALFATFGASFDKVAEDGIMPIRLTASAEGVDTVRNIPVDLSGTKLTWNNPYPAPGAADDPQPWTGEYPRVERRR